MNGESPTQSRATVSVIAPVYNQAHLLARCLDSVWFQNHPSVEIIVVDDASPDNVTAVLEAYAAGLECDRVSYASFYDAERNVVDRVYHARYPSAGRALRVLRHPENHGLAAALNTGFAAASGAYCTYVPADDRLCPAALSRLAGALDAGADFAYADMHIVDDEGRILREFAMPDYSFERCFCDWYLCGKAKMYRRSLHAECGWYDTSLLAHDHELFLRFAMAGAKFVRVPEVLMEVLDHGENRQTDIHHPASWNRLMDESRQLALKARECLTKTS